MKIAFENYGKTISVELKNDSNINDILDAVLTCCLGIGFPYRLTLEAMIEKYEELKHTIE